MNPSLPSGYRLGTQAVARASLVALALFAFLAPLITVITAGPSGAAGEGNALRQIVYVVIFGLTLASAKVLDHPARLGAVPLSIVLFLLWAAVTLVGAVNPEVGARRLFLTVLVIYTVFMLVDRVGFEGTVGALRAALLVVLVLNYVAVLGWPEWGIHQAATEDDPSIVGAWRGVLLQKNFAGAVCAMTVILFAFDAASLRPWWRLAVIALAGFFLYHSESKTSTALLVASLAFAWLFLRYEPRHRTAVCAATWVTLAALALMAWLNWDALTAPLLREDALTGRVQIWPPLLAYWRDHWLTGSGFGSFWNVGDPEPITAYTDGWVSQITSGHNGFLDLLVQTGVPGLVLALAAAAIVPASRLLSLTDADAGRRSLVLAMILFSVGHNVTESSLFDRDATIHIFLMVALALLRLEARASSEPA
ncbi:MAG: O-antigen ligase domain-containing protein [Burkholderiales bacterium]|nr:MAG: O-antigen ligase domain-containing protein [Burkholderiales bacterium]